MGLFDWFRRATARCAPAPAVAEAAEASDFYGEEALMEGDFVVSEGRRHVATAPYLLPKDLEEGNRLDFQHFILRYALRGNYAAPLAQPRDILDIGTGTGRWAAEMATVFPTANVVGVDLVTPTFDSTPDVASTMRPENYVFVQGNVLDGLPFPDNSFDFVHARLLVFGVPTARWEDIFREARRLLRADGWFESVEAVFHENGGPDLDLIGSWADELMKRRGIDVSAVRAHGERLQRVGFVNVQTHYVTLPIGRTGKRLGNLIATDYLSLMGGLRSPLVAQSIVSPQEFDAVLARARVTVHQYPCKFHMPIAVGQKLF